MKQTQKETTDHYPLVNPVQYFPALPLHSVDISSISGIIYSALKVYFCYKIIKRAFFWGTLGGFPWALGKTVLSAKPQSIGSDCKLAGLSGFWDMQMLHLVSTVFLKRWISFHIKKKIQILNNLRSDQLGSTCRQVDDPVVDPLEGGGCSVICRSPTVPKHLTCLLTWLAPADTWVGKSWAGSLGFQDYNLWFCDVLCSEVLLLRNTIITQNRVGNRAREVPQVRGRTMFGAITNSRYSWWERENLAGYLSEAVLQPRQKTRNWALYTVSLLCAGLYRDDFISSAQDENNCTNNSKEA